MSLFEQGDFKLHSGDESWWRLNCDALTDEDIAVIARLLFHKLPPFMGVTCPASHEGSAAIRLVDALGQYLMPDTWNILIVDDVLTTGSSMLELKQGYIDFSNRTPTSFPMKFIGAVIFARGPCPEWITPVFQFMIGEK